jgi:hypothetical protein
MTRNTMARVYAQETMAWARHALELSEFEVGQAFTPIARPFSVGMPGSVRHGRRRQP